MRSFFPLFFLVLFVGPAYLLTSKWILYGERDCVGSQLALETGVCYDNLTVGYSTCFRPTVTGATAFLGLCVGSDCALQLFSEGHFTSDCTTTQFVINGTLYNSQTVVPFESIEFYTDNSCSQGLLSLTADECYEIGVLDLDAKSAFMSDDAFLHGYSDLGCSGAINNFYQKTVELLTSFNNCVNLPSATQSKFYNSYMITTQPQSPS